MDSLTRIVAAVRESLATFFRRLEEDHDDHQEMSRAEKIAYAEGAQAQSLSDNPYPTGTRLHERWREGWLDNDWRSHQW